MLAAILGAGPVADAFFIALRLPNHFRAIFAEGAFNAAFVPAYARIRARAEPPPAELFCDRVFTMLLVAQTPLLAASAVVYPGSSRYSRRGSRETRTFCDCRRTHPDYLSVSASW